jgi:hypothetical protein
VLVGVFDHVSGFLLAAGLLALAGRRWDRDARRWRLCIVGAVALWAVVWGMSFLAQAGTTHASWIDRATLRSVGDGVAALVTNQDGVALVVLAVIAAGVVVTVRTDRVLGRVVLCCGVLPIVAAALIGVFVPFFIDRTLTVAAWAPCLAIGMAADAAWRRARLAGVAVVLLIGALVVPSTLVFLDRHWEYDASVDHLLTVARPGDVVATIPGWYGPLVDWRVGTRAFGAVQPERVAALPAAHAIRLGDATATGRMWVLSFHGDHRTYPGAARCGPDWDDGVTVVSCLRIPAGH